MARQRLKAVWLVLLVFGALAGCCLDFDGQSVYVEHDQQKDRLLLIIQYQGIYANARQFLHENKVETGPSAEAERLWLSAKERAQGELQQAIENKAVALFDPLLAPRPAGFDKEPTAVDEKEGRPGSLRKMRQSMGRNLRVMNAGFYLNPEGEVCAAQVVVLERAAEMVDLMNDMVTEVYKENAAEAQGSGQDILALLSEGPADASEETDTDLFIMTVALLKAARQNHRWLRLTGHSLTLAVPIPERFLHRHWGESLHEVLRCYENISTGRTDKRRRGAERPAFIWHEDGVLKIKIGFESEPATFATKPKRGEYVPNLAEHIRQTYGLHLDANLARYLAEPDAAAESEAEQAAQIMAPRLSQAERVRVLTRQLRSAPAEKYWLRLRQEPIPGGEGRPTDAVTNEELLALWEKWLREHE